MKCLSVRQPHAWALIHGPKRIENRTWWTAYRGPLVIHASLRPDDMAFHEYGLTLETTLQYGSCIGVVDLIDCAPVNDVWDEPFAEGPWCLITANARPLTPFPCKGRLGLFTPPEGLLWADGTPVALPPRAANWQRQGELFERESVRWVGRQDLTDTPVGRGEPLA